MVLHISRVEIKNFRNFRHLTLDPFPARAVILGENGVGKSNLIRALQLVLDPSLPDSARQLRAEDVWQGHPRGLAGGAKVKVQVELQGYDDDDDAKSVLSGCNITTAPYTARLTYTFKPRVAVPAAASAPAGSEGVASRPLTTFDYEYTISGGHDASADIRRVRNFVSLKLLHALRDAESDLRNWRRNPLRELLELLPLDPVNLQDTADAMQNAVDQLTSDPNVAALETNISTRLALMAGPRLPINPRLGFASSEADELVRAVRLFVDSARRQGVSDASLGSANVLYLGLLLEALSLQRSRDAFVATFLAVEEPEAHLHVGLQRHLFRYLLRTESSLLLTTHSPHIAAVAPLGSFVVLRSTSRGTVGATSGALQVTEEVAEDLERYLDVSRAEILFAPLVILVEGLAETYVVPSLSAALGFDLDAYGIVVASVQGTDFSPYLRLLGSTGLKTPVIVVTDGDAEGEKSGRTEAGIRRGIRLLAKPRERTRLNGARLELLKTTVEVDYAEQRAALLTSLQAHGIFVGKQTLEADLAKAFGSEIADAVKELTKNRAAIRDVEAGIKSAGDGDGDLAATKRMVKRINAIGKGRFAQRFASHLRRSGTIHRLAMLTEGADLIGSQFVDSTLGDARYLFDALDEASLRVRGHGLLEDAASSPDAADTVEPQHPKAD